MEYLFESATKELQEELGDKNYKVVFESNSQKYEVHQYIPGEGWICSAIYSKWGPEQLREYKIFYYESHDGKDFEAWREDWRRQRAVEERRITAEDSDMSREIGHDLFHATGKRVW